MNQWQLKNTTVIRGPDLLTMTDEEDERATDYLMWVAQSGMMYSLTLEPGEELTVQLLLFMMLQDPEQMGPLTREERLCQMNPSTILQVQPLTSTLASYISGLRFYRPVITFLASDERYLFNVNRAARHFRSRSDGHSRQLYHYLRRSRQAHEQGGATRISLGHHAKRFALVLLF